MLEDLIGDVPAADPAKTSLPTLVQPEPMSETLVEGYLKYFAKADSSIKWLDAELELEMWLCPDDCESCAGAGYVDERPCPFSKTLLVGRVDTIGQRLDGEKFFLDLKTSAPPPRTRINEWKVRWLMSPQALTYGLLIDRKYPGLRTFTVRMLYKSTPPSYDFEWFKFTGEEIVWWKSEILRTAEEIRRLRKARVQPWPPNFQRCFKYGVNYVCPFFHAACSKLDWEGVPEGVTPRMRSHLNVENAYLETETGSFGQPFKKGLVILDATRLDMWECRERYRRNYEGGATASGIAGARGWEEPEAIARSVGIDVHSLLDQRYKMLLQPSK